MSGPFGSSQFMYATGGVEEGQSLRFEDGDSAYLSFTPASAGNQKTWTWSGWVKRGNLDASKQLFMAGTNGTNDTDIYFLSTNKLRILNRTSSSVNTLKDTTAVYRDVSAWYHVVVSWDTTQATADDRIKLYINGEQVTSFSTNTIPSQNTNSHINDSVAHRVGSLTNNSQYWDGYLANVAFIDGTALTPTSFGEYDDTLWKPKSDTDIQALTFGTNGFYLPFKQTTEAEGFSTVTYSGNGGTQSIEGVGFEPDFVWIKSRNNGSAFHSLSDSVRGVTKFLYSNSTAAEATSSVPFKSFDSSGFTVASDTSTSRTNVSGENYVAWCWDAGTGSAASNTDGSITSSVKANTTNGFSIATYTGNGSSGATFGHGLGVAPDMVIVKRRDGSNSWQVYTSVLGATKFLELHSTGAEQTATNRWNDTAPSSSVVTLGNNSNVNSNGGTCVAYSFASVSGYSDIGSYTGTGSAGNSITGLGFKPAWVIIKETSNAGSWHIYDNTRSPVNPASYLLADTSNAEDAFGAFGVDFDSDGFTIQNTGNGTNRSGGAYIYMAFADTRDATFFGDTSGNSNNWTPNKLNNTDVVLDAPVSGGNFAVWNVTSQQSSSSTFSEGNLKGLIPASTANGKALPTIGVSSGKWYWEYYYLVSNGNYLYVGITDPSAYTDNSYWIRGSDGETFKYENGSNSTGSGTTHRHAQGDVIQVAFDADNRKWYVGKNGTWSLSGDPVAGTGYVHNNIVSGAYGPFAANATSGNSQTIVLNTGVDSSFAGNETSQGNTDDNGQGDFFYAPPSGYLALKTSNLPTPTITAPDEYFNTVLYTGTGTAPLAITGVGHAPDWIWLKRRSAASNHHLFDSVRGTGKFLQSSSTGAESSGSNNIASFDSDGFTLNATSANNPAENNSGDTYVTWNWKAGGTAVSNTDGSITSSVSANTDAGFSIVSYTGSGANATVGHGLSSAPEMILFKKRDVATSWMVYNQTIGNNRFLYLDLTNGQTGTSSTYFNNLDPTASVINLGTYHRNNSSTEPYIAYCFHSVEGYSKIGSYTGNGSADGTFVHCGFRPAWIMVKRTDSTGNWQILDNKRDPENADPHKYLYANLSNAEASSSTADYEFLSNGYKLRDTGTDRNASGGSYIFLAFAEAPFKSANAR